MKPTELSPPSGAVPIGYAKVIVDYKLSVLVPDRLSFIGKREHRHVTADGRSQRVFTPQFDPGPTDAAHLEFAIKHDGVNLEVLDAYFEQRGADLESELTQLVKAKPTGVFARRLWFFYEWLTERQLPLDDMTVGNYQPLLEPTEYVTLERPHRIKRQRLWDNLLGVRSFCPMVRRSSALQASAHLNLSAAISQLVNTFNEQSIRRAVNYLYTRETRSSFEIERERPNDKRVERYMALLRDVPEIEQLNEQTLVTIQNETVESRFAEKSFRTEQNYVGQTLGLREKVHYLPPRPEEIAALMDGWVAMCSRLSTAPMDAVIHAAVISFAFVFLHPFVDGNGRMHRLLIHHVLSRRGFTPKDLIFPISAVIVRKLREYDDCLESFSKPVMSLVSYQMDDEGRVTLDEDTSRLYRFLDLTRMAEDLYQWVEDTIQTDFRNELEFVVEFHKVKDEVRRVVDLPDRLLNLFIRVAVHNGGKISASKRAKFEKLTDAELASMEAIVEQHLPKLAPAADLD